MKNSFTSRFLFSALFAFFIVISVSCSKEDNQGEINTEIFFEANFSNGSSATNYGPLPYGRRPETIGGAGIVVKEIIDANGEDFTTITVSVRTEEYGRQKISLGKISAFIKLIKPGKGIEGTYNTYLDPLGVQLNIGAPNNINSYLVDGPGFTINKTGATSISGSYAEGSYTYLGKSIYEPGLEKTISGKFRLYLSK